jgi:transcriptional regulator with XRE-family HTH domain/tetratricopeptide (TPR) repeat protein
LGERRLGDLLRGHRQDADLTIEALAAASGVSDRGIGDIERGVSRGPQRRTVQALADALGLDPEARAVLLRAAREGRRRSVPRTEAAPGTHPLPLPRPVPDFTGRDRERSRLVAVLAGARAGAGSPVALVAGGPGLGKTTLAVQVALDLRAEFPEQVFLDLRGADPDPVAPEAAVRRLVDALGPGGAPAGAAAASEHLRGQLAGRRVLLVLDNAAAEDQVRALVPAEGPAAVLVTARRKLAGLDGVHREVLGRLAPADSVALLGRIVPGEPGRADAADLARLAALCDDVPLALRIAGNRLAARAGWPVAGLVSRMEVEERRLDALTAGDLRVTAAFTSSYEQLGPGAQRLFRRLALLDAPSTGVALAAALVGETVWRTEDLLDELTDLSLVQHLPGDRYQQHDLLRLFARYELDHQEPAAQQAAVRAAADDWLLSTTVRAGRRFEPEHAAPAAPAVPTSSPAPVWPVEPGTAAERVVTDHAAPTERPMPLDPASPPAPSAAAPSAPPAPAEPDLPDPDAAQVWLRAEAGSWLAALRRCADRGDHARVTEVADALHWFSDLWTTWGHWPEVFARSARAAGALGDDRLVAVHEGYLAWAQTECAGDPVTALVTVGRALAAAERGADVAQQGWALSYRSWIRSRLGDVDAAVQDARASADRFLAAGEREGAPQALLALAGAQVRLGRFDAGAAAAREAIALVQDPATRPRAQVAEFTLASAHGYLAGALARGGRWAEGVAAADVALALAVPLGVPRMIAAGHEYRGIALAGLGRHAAAAEALRTALAIRREMPDLAGVGRVTAALDRLEGPAVGPPTAPRSDGPSA